MNGVTSTKFLCLVLVLFVLAGCKTRKERVSVLVEGERLVSRSESAAVWRGMADTRMEYATFVGRAKSTFALNKDIHDVTTHVRIRKDEAIWISVTAVLGMEVARVLITPDRVRIINRMQSVYVDQPFAYIHRFANEQLDFQAVQDLLMGEVLWSVIEEDAQLTAFEGGYVLREDKHQIAYEQTIDFQHSALSTVLEDADANQRLTAVYQNRGALGDRLAPAVLQLAMFAEELDLQIDMAYNRIAFDDPVEIPFTVPSRFTEAN